MPDPSQTFTITPEQWQQFPIAKPVGPEQPHAAVEGALPQLLQMLGDATVGGGKGLLESGMQGGELLRKIPGVNQLSDQFPSFNVNTDAANPSQNAGKILEHLAEILYGGGAIGSAIKPSVVGLGMRGAAGNKLLMNAGAISKAIGQGTAAAGSDLLHHGGDNAMLDAGLAAAGPVAGAGAEALMQTPIGRTVLPYLAAIGVTSAARPILGETMGLGAGLTGFGMTNQLMKRAAQNPTVLEKLQQLLNLSGAGAAATTSELNR